MTKKLFTRENNPLADFEWPEYKTQVERIKSFSKRYGHLDITEAFEAHYNIKINPQTELCNQMPTDVNIGDIITTNIKSISKDNVVFDSMNHKALIQSSVNLNRYKHFGGAFLGKDIKVKVDRIIKDTIYVNPISPLLDEWLNPILNDTDSQKNLKEPISIKVKDLQLQRGGFMGKAVIPNVSDLLGEDYVMDSFIPGSQIVLNIPENFEEYNGLTVDAFIVNYMSKPNDPTKMSLICSAKEYLKFQGDKNLIKMFNAWCEENEYWNEVSKMVWEGSVTGIINSSKKCGVFVEIPELNITGMVDVAADQLVNYKPHQSVNIKLVKFDEKTFFNNEVGQVQHVDPYIIKDGVLKKCNLKPVFEFV